MMGLGLKTIHEDVLVEIKNKISTTIVSREKLQCKMSIGQENNIVMHTHANTHTHARAHTHTHTYAHAN